MKKNPNVQLHGLLFETMMVLLIKQVRSSATLTARMLCLFIISSIVFHTFHAIHFRSRFHFMQDDKYILKYQSSPGLGSGESRSIEGRFNPITKINLIFVRQSAVEKNTFFLINTNVSQMLELTAPSGSECKTYVYANSTIEFAIFITELELCGCVHFVCRPVIMETRIL